MKTSNLVTVNIETDNLIDSLVPLYHQYDGQTGPQDAYLEIDPHTREAKFDYSGEIGNAVSMAVWHSLVLQVTVSPYASENALHDLARDEDLRALVTRVCDGHSVEWDGSNNVGSLTDDAQNALDEIENMLDGIDLVSVWDGSDWLNGDLYNETGGLMTPSQIANLTDPEIADLSTCLAHEARADGIVVCNLTEAIEKLRDHALDKTTDYDYA